MMTEPAFFVLTALVEQPRHGYAIVAEVEALSEGRVHLRVGTLYGVLDRLASDGLIDLEREETYQGRLRRYYRISDSGRGALAEEAARLAANASAASARLNIALARFAGPAIHGGAA